MLEALRPGTVVGGDFVVVGPRGEGGMGAVYVVEQRSTGKLRALKVMHREIASDPGQERRFSQEARVGARIKSDHVVDVVAAGVDRDLDLPYLVMELLDGEDLRRRIDSRGALPHAEVAALFEQICHALGAAHDAGIVHRDVKPENVFVARAQRAGGEAFTVKVLDFGIAKITAEAGTRATRGAIGSPLWMAPEQTQPGPVTPAADVWALGLLAYEAFTGRSFWRAANEAGGTTAQLLREIVLDPIPRASTRAREQGVGACLPAGFDPWLARCLDRVAGGRFRDANAAFRALRRVLEGLPIDTGELADTAAAPLPSVTATGDSAPYVPAASAPPRPIAPETPLASTRDASRAPPPARVARDTKGTIAIALSLGVAAIAIAVAVTLAVVRTPVEVVTVAPPEAPPTSAPPAPEPGPEPPAAPESRVSAEPPIPPPAPRPSQTARATPSATQSASPSPGVAPKRVVAGGFGDPSDRKGAVLWKVQGRSVRLLTRLSKNESNVADATVRKAMEWNSWQYLRCYERAFGSLKEMPQGTVEVSFDILDQLPRHAKVESTTFESATMNECVRGTLLGQTINAAGPEGKGSAAEAFRFVPLD